MMALFAQCRGMCRGITLRGACGAREFVTIAPQLKNMPVIIPIGGGKGGVGKSFISANLGALMAKRGHRVILIDLDLGGSNLHTLLGIKSPPGGLDRFLDKTENRLEQVAVPTHISNLSFISSLHCSMEIANLYHAQKVKLIHAILRLPCDCILLDLGAGTHFNTLDFFLTSEAGVFVCTPEPTAIENAFRFIKAAYLRKLKQIISRNAFHKIVKDAVQDGGNQALRYTDLVDLVLKYDPGMEMFLRDSIRRLQFRFILNQFRKSTDSTLGEKIKTVCNRHFYSPFEFLGQIDFDERVTDSILSKNLFTLQYPESKTAIDFRAIVDQLAPKRVASHTMVQVR